MGLIANLEAIVQAARNAGVRGVIAPHRRWEPADYEDWSHPNPTQIGIMNRHSFARGECGGDWRPEFAPQPGRPRRSRTASSMFPKPRIGWPDCGN